MQQLFPKNRAIYEIMWKNVVQPNRQQVTDFEYILYLSFFRKFGEKLEVSLKFDKNNGYSIQGSFDTCDCISLHSS